MKKPIAIYEWGALIAARLERGSVVLDERTSSLFQLSEPAALALDVLADRALASNGDETYAQIRDALPIVRRELLGESVLAPGEGVTVEGKGGHALLRRIAEPPHWRRTRRAESASRTVEITAAMVRLSDGVLVILAGRRRELAELRFGLAELGAGALARDVVTFEPRAPVRVHSKAWGPCLVREVWSLERRISNNLVLLRLGPAAALVGLLEAATRRPSAQEMRVLASTCLSRPQFRATLPAGGHALAATFRSYGAF